MDFSLSKKEILFQQMIRAFAEKEVKPLAAEVDEEERFPVETVEKMAKLGIMGIPFPVEYGGAGGDNVLNCPGYVQRPGLLFLPIPLCVLLRSMNSEMKNNGKNIYPNYVRENGSELLV